MGPGWILTVHWPLFHLVPHPSRINRHPPLIRPIPLSAPFSLPKRGRVIHFQYVCAPAGPPKPPFSSKAKASRLFPFSHESPLPNNSLLPFLFALRPYRFLGHRRCRGPGKNVTDCRLLLSTPASPSWPLVLASCFALPSHGSNPRPEPSHRIEPMPSRRGSPLALRHFFRNTDGGRHFSCRGRPPA